MKKTYRKTIQIGKDYRINSNRIRYGKIERKIAKDHYLISGYNAQAMKQESMVIHFNSIGRKFKEERN